MSLFNVYVRKESANHQQKLFGIQYQYIDDLRYSILSQIW